jgi:hypothetical protein
MSKSEIKRILRRNKKVGRRPWSLYQIAQMHGCSRSFVTMYFQGKKTSRPLDAWLESVLGPVQPAA